VGRGGSGRAKAAVNRRKHGISFEEAGTVLLDPLAATVEAPGPHDEVRCITLGISTEGRLLYVVHTSRGDRLRLISARRATRPERKLYENEQ
jgi:uncharacterized DUF497 family protein